MCSIPAHSVLYLIQHYVIKFVSDLRQNDVFLQVLYYHQPNCPPRYEAIIRIRLCTKDHLDYICLCVPMVLILHVLKY
jgi:hypothetical protein